MPTVKDVASKAKNSWGLSLTCSPGVARRSDHPRNVLVGHRGVGYQPNILARSLINRRRKTIAVVAVRP